MTSLSLIDMMYFFITGQVVMILCLVLFIKDKRPDEKDKESSVLQKELDRITLPPIDGIIYPGQHSERHEA